MELERGKNGVGLTLDHVEADSDHDCKKHINNAKLTRTLKNQVDHLCKNEVDQDFKKTQVDQEFKKFKLTTS